MCESRWNRKHLTEQKKQGPNPIERQYTIKINRIKPERLRIRSRTELLVHRNEAGYGRPEQELLHSKPNIESCLTGGRRTVGLSESAATGAGRDTGDGGGGVGQGSGGGRGDANAWGRPSSGSFIWPCLPLNRPGSTQLRGYCRLLDRPGDSS